VIDTSSCRPTTFQGVRDRLIDHFNNNDVPADGLNGVGFRDYFRKWVNICRVSVTPGTYYLQVQSPSGNGHNRFAVRANVSGSTGGVVVHGDQHMAIYANAPTANTTFYLARVPSSAANHTLVVDLYDIGDADSTGTLSIVRPSDASGTFGNCTFRKGIDGSVTTSPGCSVSGVSSSNGYNGRIDEFRIPVPADYSCTDTDPTGCWFKINLSFGGRVQDTTTWSAHLDGDPVRLIK
jgi:hypothetical protein